MLPRLHLIRNLILKLYMYKEYGRTEKNCICNWTHCSLITATPNNRLYSCFSVPKFSLDKEFYIEAINTYVWRVRISWEELYLQLHALQSYFFEFSWMHFPLSSTDRFLCLLLLSPRKCYGNLQLAVNIIRSQALRDTKPQLKVEVLQVFNTFYDNHNKATSFTMTSVA